MEAIRSACFLRKRKRGRTALLLVILSLQGRVFLGLVGLAGRPDFERITKAILPAPAASVDYHVTMWSERRIDDYVMANRRFPRWGEEGISIHNLLQFIHASAHDRNFSVNLLDNKSRETDLYVFPETLYVIDSDDMWVSSELRRYNRKAHADFAKYRAQPSERIMLLAYDTIRSDLEKSSERWPHLTAAFQAGGVPFLAWYGDFKSCNYNNWNKNTSIPLFTTCAKTSCDYAWPMPTYRTIKDSHANAALWEDQMNSNDAEYPWEQKKASVVWRGGLTGMIKNYTSPRARIARFGRIHRLESVVDIGLTGVPEKVMQFSKPNLRMLGGIHKPISPMEDFQKYIGIVDIDGNSWSSRFGKLLCYNSVVLKVEPQYVDYFHFNDLVPWKHYVPIKYDLSDLLDLAKFVADPRNEAIVRQIVANANQWCSTRMVHDSIALDLLDIWNDYVKALNTGDPNWLQRWNEAKPAIYKEAAYGMSTLADVVQDSSSPRMPASGTNDAAVQSE